jgi:hypothetical protein
VVVIGEEIASDAPAIRQLNEEAFGQPAEADIVERFRSSCDHLPPWSPYRKGPSCGISSLAP